MKTMKKCAFSILGLVFAATSFSQSVDDGIKFLYYEKNKSAVQALEKAVASNPKDARAIYWLGQAYIEDYENGHKTDAAEFAKLKALYTNALNNGVNDPLIIVGSAHVSLIEGASNTDVRQRFEQAITASKNKKGENPDVLNAIGRANADGPSAQGDAQYGVDVLKRAAAIDQKNPDIDINLGINYLKLSNGSQAVEAFTDATNRDPKYAAGFYRVGHVYQSQDNKSSMDEWYVKAIGADDKYGPVYYAYFDYYKNRDVNAAKEYLDKYIALADKDCQTTWFQADYLFRAGKYNESLAKADSMSAGECKTYDRLSMLYAYNYDRTGDSVKARTYLQTFFATTKAPEPDDYVLAGKVYAKFPGNEDTAAAYLLKAIALDTVVKNKATYANTALDIFTKANNIKQMIVWTGIVAKYSGGDGKLSEAKYYKLTQAAITAITAAPDSVSTMAAYTLADSISKAYIAAYPDKPQGYSALVNAAKKADKDSTHGYAIQPIATANEFYKKDTATTSKNQRFLNDYYLVFYYLYHEKTSPRIENYKKAIAICDEMMTYLDPASDSYKFAQSTGDQLKKAVAKFEASKNAPASSGAKPAAKPAQK